MAENDKQPKAHRPPGTCACGCGATILNLDAIKIGLTPRVRNSSFADDALSGTHLRKVEGGFVSAEHYPRAGEPTREQLAEMVKVAQGAAVRLAQEIAEVKAKAEQDYKLLNENNRALKDAARESIGELIDVGGKVADLVSVPNSRYVNNWIRKCKQARARFA